MTFRHCARHGAQNEAPFRRFIWREAMLLRNVIAHIALVGVIAALALAAVNVDMQDAMAKCQKRASFATCHASLYR